MLFNYKLLGRIVYGIISVLEETVKSKESQAASPQKLDKPTRFKILQWIYLIIGIVYLLLGVLLLKSTSHPSLLLGIIMLFLIPLPFFIFFYSLLKPSVITLTITKIITLIIVVGWFGFAYKATRPEECIPECPSLGDAIVLVLTLPIMILSILHVLISLSFQNKIRSSP